MAGIAIGSSSSRPAVRRAKCLMFREGDTYRVEIWPYKSNVEEKVWEEAVDGGHPGLKGLDTF